MTTVVLDYNNSGLNKVPKGYEAATSNQIWSYYILKITNAWDSLGIFQVCIYFLSIAALDTTWLQCQPYMVEYPAY